jgi:hypothetical protein
VYVDVKPSPDSRSLTCSLPALLDMGTGYGDGGMGSTDFNSGRPLPTSPRASRSDPHHPASCAALIQILLIAGSSCPAAGLPQQHAAVAKLWPGPRRPRLSVNLAGQPARTGRRAGRLPVRRPSIEFRLQHRAASTASEYRQCACLLLDVTVQAGRLIELPALGLAQFNPGGPQPYNPYGGAPVSQQPRYSNPYGPRGPRDPR